MRLFLALLFLSLSLSARATNFYIVPGGTGDQSGSSWSNAMDGIQTGSLVRGSTNFIASGSYGARQFTTATSGTTYIYFKKATASSHGTDTGWQSSYGTGQAVFTSSGACWDLRTSYLDFDGQVGDGFTSTCGFKLKSTYVGSSNQGAWNVYGGQTATHINTRHVEIEGMGPDVDGNHRGYGVAVLSLTGSDYLWQYCYIHDVDAWIAPGTSPNCTIDHCYLKNAGSSSASDHGVGISFSGSNVTISNNRLENMLGNSNTTYIEPQSFPDGIYVYGNVYLATDPTAATTQWANLCTPSSSWYQNHTYYYNNTSYGLVNAGVSLYNIGTPVPGGLVSVIQDNVWVGNSDTFEGFNNAAMANNNILPSSLSPSFANAADGDFHLTAPTANGVSLVSPYNVDPDGVTRVIGAWSLGAYQYTGAVTPPQLPQISFSLASYSCNETDGSITLTITKTGAGAATVFFNTAPGSATGGNDYSPTNITISFLSSDIQKTIQVGIIDSHTLQAQPRTFFVNLSNPVGAILNLSMAIVSINMNSVPPVISLQWITNAVAFQQPLSFPTNIAFRVSRSGSSNGAISVNWATLDGTAIHGHDYTQVSGIDNWADGDLGIKTNLVSFIPSGDTGFTNRTMTVVLSTPSGAGAVLGSYITETAMEILNNPTTPTNNGTIFLSAPTYNTSEISTNLVISISCVNLVNQTASIHYSFSNVSATNGVDYTGIPATLTITTNGIYNLNIPIPFTGKTGLQPLTFFFTLDSPINANLGLSQALVSIQLLPTATINSVITMKGIILQGSSTLK